MSHQVSFSVFHLILNSFNVVIFLSLLSVNTSRSEMNVQKTLMYNLATYLPSLHHSVLIVMSEVCVHFYE